MGELDKGGTVTLQELVISSLAQTDAVAKLLNEKGVITQDEFMEKIKSPCFPSKINTITASSHGFLLARYEIEFIEPSPTRICQESR